MGDRLILTCGVGLLLAIVAGPVTAESDDLDYPSLEEVERQLIERTASISTVEADVTIELPESQSLIAHPSTFHVSTIGLPVVYEGRYCYRRHDDRIATRLDMYSQNEPAFAEPGDVVREDYLDHGYVAARTDFALGHLVHGLASKALGRDNEASDHFHEAIEINARLKDLVEVLKSDQYNTVLVVGYGVGPRKIAYGPDNALARFVPTPGFESSASPLTYRVNDSNIQMVPVVCDVNQMALDHMWNNLEDIRLAKSAIGRSLMQAGQQMASSGGDYSAVVGLAVQAVGAAVRAGAHADTRYCEAIPQRFYLVPLNIVHPGTTVELGVRGRPGSRLVLPGLAPPGRGNPIAMRYVHLVPSPLEVSWTTSRRVLYGNDSCETGVGGDDLPYILGGRCVRRPSEAVLAHYRQAGNLMGMSLTELEDLYRAEGIALTLGEEGGRAGLHILEGGTSLEPPVVGSAGFKRLFCQEHATYVPRSERVRELAERIQAERSALARGASDGQ